MRMVRECRTLTPLLGSAIHCLAKQPGLDHPWSRRSAARDALQRISRNPPHPLPMGEGRVLRALIVFGIALLFFTATARADVAIPALKARVTDLTNTLTTQQTQQLESELATLEQRKGAQVVVLMLPTTQPETIEQYATRVFDQWKIGRKKVDDGVLVVVAKNDHRAYIETGYGLEGAIPDALAFRIIKEDMTPKFRTGDFYGGLHDGVGAIEKLIDGEALPPPPSRQTDDGARLMHGGWFNGLIVAWIALVWARGIFGRVPRIPRAGLVGAATGGLAWLFSGLLPLGIALGVIGLIFGYVGRTGGAFAHGGGIGGWGGGGFGGGGFGGGGGGGFSGGGGMTGGGGASGSW